MRKLIISLLIILLIVLVGLLGYSFLDFSEAKGFDTSVNEVGADYPEQTFGDEQVPETQIIHWGGSGSSDCSSCSVE